MNKRRDKTEYDVLGFLEHAIHLTEALKVQHDQGLVHGRLKPDAFVTDATGKISLPNKKSGEHFLLAHMFYEGYVAINC